MPQIYILKKNLPKHVEDMDWCWLARKEGYKVAFVPERKVIHYGGGEAHTENTLKMMNENFKKFIKI